MTKSLFTSRYMTKLFAIARKSTLLNAKCCHSIELEETRRPAKLETTQPGLLESWFFGVERFGKVCISVPCNLNIESLDPQCYPDMGKLFIKLNYSPEDGDHQSDHYNNTSLAALTKLYDFEIDTADSNNLSICAKFNTMATFPATCTIQMPLNFDLNVECTGKSTSVRNIENNGIHISTSNSICTLHNIKGENVTVQSKGGDILCKKVVQGNINMSVTGKGSIQTERLQGQSIQCSVDEGNITTTSVYSTSSVFTCNHGNINLMNVHGASKTSVIQGNLVLDSLDGSLESKVDNGSTEIFISKADDVNIETNNGDITVKFSENVASLDLEGTHITCDQKLNLIDTKIDSTGNSEKLEGDLSGTGGKIKATTKNGNITVKYLDWMESLKLQQKIRTD